MSSATAIAMEMPKRGRPRTETIPSERAKHIKAFVARRVHGWPTHAIARMLDVDRKTVQRWVKLASGYPEAKGLGRTDPAIN